MIIAGLALLGICFGSFINALVWRLHQQNLTKKKRKATKKELSISHGRSMCVHCGHTLNAVDLIPVLSWITLRGKCRYCKKKISAQYPVVETLTALLFITSYVWWPTEINGLEIITFAAWLMCLIGLIALAVYDIRWMLLPNKIIFPLFLITTVFVVSKIVDQGSLKPLLSAIVAALIGGGLFYVLFQISDGSWIGGGDVKLGFLLGSLLSGPVASILMLFIASLLGSILALSLMSAGRATRTSRIPFGPFLIISAIIVQLFGSSLIQWYNTTFINI